MTGGRITNSTLTRTSADLTHLATGIGTRLPATLAKLREYSTGPRAASLEPGRSHQASSPVEQAAGQPDPARNALADLAHHLGQAHQHTEAAARIVGHWAPRDTQTNPSCSSCGARPANDSTAGNNLATPTPLCQTCIRFVKLHGRLPDRCELNQRAAGGQMRAMMSATSRPA